MKQKFKRAILATALISAFAVQAQSLPAGSIGSVQGNTANQFSNYTFNFTATTTGANYIGFAFRQDPAYWTFGNVGLTTGGGSNLLTNGNLANGGPVQVTTNSGTQTIQAPANWGVWYQAGTYPAAAGSWSAGQWYDGAVGSFDGIYQGVALNAGTLYTITFTAMSNNAVDNNAIQLGVYAGACSSVGGLAAACVPNTPSFAPIATPNQTINAGNPSAPPVPVTPVTPPGPTLVNDMTGTTGSDVLGTTPSFNGGTLQIVADGATLNQLFGITSAGGTVDQNGLNATFTGVISGTGDLTITNSSTGGSITLTAQNTYTGATTINSGATLINDGSISSSSSVTNDGTFTNNGQAPVVTNNSTFTNGATGTVDYLVNNSNGVAINNGTINGTSTNYGTLTNNGSIWIVNTFGTFTNNGTTANVNNGGTYTNNGTSMNVNNSGGIFNNNSTGVINNLYNTGTTTNDGTVNGSTNNNGGIITNNGTMSSVLNGGTFTNNGTTTTVTNTGAFANNGTTGDVNNSSIFNNSNTTGNIINTGTFANNGTTGAVNNSLAFANSGSTGAVTNTGTFINAGSILSINNSGTFNTIASGTTLHLSSYTQTSAGSTIINGTQRIVVSGSANLNGNLTVLNTPRTYGNYTYLTANTVTGKYNSLTLNPDLAPLGYGLVYTGNTVSLKVTPSASYTSTAVKTTVSSVSNINNLQSASLGGTLNYDCNLFGENNICMSTGVRSTSDSAGNLQGGNLVFGYRLTPNWRVGAFADQGFKSLTVSNNTLSNSSPSLGVFVNWNEDERGYGWGIQSSAATSSNTLTISRAGSQYSELAKGTSSTSGQALQVKTTYAMPVTSRDTVTPYAGIRYIKITDNGYTESGAIYPITYGSVTQSTTDALAGVSLSHNFGRLTGSVSTGVIQNLNYNAGTLTGTSGIIGLNSINTKLPGSGYTSASLGAGVSYDLFKNQYIGANIGWQQKSLLNTSILSGAVTYTVGF